MTPCACGIEFEFERECECEFELDAEAEGDGLGLGVLWTSTRLYIPSSINSLSRMKLVLDSKELPYTKKAGIPDLSSWWSLMICQLPERQLATLRIQPETFAHTVCRRRQT